jgi:hypothetical protein
MGAGPAGGDVSVIEASGSWFRLSLGRSEPSRQHCYWRTGTARASGRCQASPPANMSFRVCNRRRRETSMPRAHGQRVDRVGGTG